MREVLASDMFTMRTSKAHRLVHQTSNLSYVAAPLQSPPQAPSSFATVVSIGGQVIIRGASRASDDNTPAVKFAPHAPRPFAVKEFTANVFDEPWDALEDMLIKRETAMRLHPSYRVVQ